MGLVKLLSRLTSESERDLTQRLNRAMALMGLKDHRNLGNEKVSGRVYMVTTWSVGKGEEDFIRVLDRKHHRITKIFRVQWQKHGKEALSRTLKLNQAEFGRGDIVAIVRGGGDLSSPSFLPFNDQAAVRTLSDIRATKGVIVVTGIGHATDHFAVDSVADFRQNTPTDAAYKVSEMLRVSE